MELHEIRYFLALSRTRNFTRAAELCHVSQPALTRAIQKMEDELGGLLVSRERNNIRLTELGRMIEPHLAETQARSEAAKETATRMLRPGNRRLRIGVASALGPLLIANFMQRFWAGQVGVELVLSEALGETLADRLQAGELDAALMPGPPVRTACVQWLPLYHERFVVVCAAEHPIARRNVVRAADLDGQVWLSRPDRDEHAERLCAQSGVHLKRCFRGEGDDWMLAMVAAGMGICFLPEYANLTTPGVTFRPVIDPELGQDVCLGSLPMHAQSAPLASFLRAARDYAWPKDQSLAA